MGQGGEGYVVKMTRRSISTTWSCVWACGDDGAEKFVGKVARVRKRKNTQARERERDPLPATLTCLFNDHPDVSDQSTRAYSRLHGILYTESIISIS